MEMLILIASINLTTADDYIGTATTMPNMKVCKQVKAVLDKKLPEYDTWCYESVVNRIIFAQRR